MNLEITVKKSFNFLKKFKNLSYNLLRFGLGIAFIIHGISKFPLPPQKLIDYFGFSPLLASFVAISELLAGTFLILAGFLKNNLGDFITRISSFVIIVIMICAFYIAHQDWFISTKLFTSEQIFLFLIGIFFFINGNNNS